MTNPTQEQRARWLELAKKFDHYPDALTQFTFEYWPFFDFCATIAAEAVAAERARLSAGVEMTDEEIKQKWNEALYTPASGWYPVLFARALIAEASARATVAERERCARWHEDKARICHDAWIVTGASRFLDVRKAHLASASAIAHRAGEE